VRKPTMVALALTVIGATVILIGQVRSVDSTEELQVVRVVDGDTIVGYYDGQKETVRLIGIDAPEIGNCHSLQASVLLAHIALDQTLRAETESKARDKYGRLLLNLYTRDNQLINQILVRKGAAVRMTVHPNTEHTFDLYAAQRTAERMKVGMHRKC